MDRFSFREDRADVVEREGAGRNRLIDPTGMRGYLLIPGRYQVKNAFLGGK
jgi:hypothetical protein